MATWTSSRPVPEEFNPRPIRDVLARHKRGEKPERVTVDAFPVYKDDPLRESHLLLDGYLKGAGKHAFNVKPKSFEAGRAIMEMPPEKWPALIRAMLVRLLYFWATCVKPAKAPAGGLDGFEFDDDGSRSAFGPLASALMRGDPRLRDADLVDWIDAITIEGHVGSQIRGYLEAEFLVRAAEVHVEHDGLSTTLADALRRFREFRKDEYQGWGREEQELLTRLGELLGEVRIDRKAILDRGEPWAEAVLAHCVSRESANEARPSWQPLLKHAKDSDGSKPTGKWLKQAKKLIDELGGDEFQQCAGEWLTLAIKPRTVPLEDHQCATPWHRGFDIYSDRNDTVLKGLAWACAASADARLSGPLGALAEACYKKIPNYGPRCPKVGNACLIALTLLPGQEPRAELTRLKAKVKQPTARKMIEKAIGRSAEAAGLTPDDLEEMSFATYGLTEIGRGETKIGPYRVVTSIAGTTKVELSFIDAKGKSRASVPADLKDSHAEAVKSLQQSCKELSKMLPALRDRLERLPMSRRELPLGAWRERYLDHPVVGAMARRLIWDFTSNEKTIAGAWHDGRLVNADGKPLSKLEDAKTIVRLWHPALTSAAGVLAWRNFLQLHEITQPFKQAYREVYLLTDAERTTRTYSNRFAAHLLRQHVFAALCTQRGWKYRLMGSWDGGGDTTPRIDLPRWGLYAEFWLAGGEGTAGGTGVAQLVSTDQVRFYEASEVEPMTLERVPPLAFSEVMRDVDLFVGVASIGNDPNWHEAGDRVGTYWHEHTFGELGVTAETRRAVLERLVPRLKIADRCKLDGRFLVVRGDTRTYKIHLGSGNILMEPNDQYLCIVPDRSTSSKSPGDVFLPFEGDTTLSVIISKAFLLAEDAKIKDETIIRQIAPSPRTR